LLHFFGDSFVFAVQKYYFSLVHDHLTAQKSMFFNPLNRGKLLINIKIKKLVKPLGKYAVNITTLLISNMLQTI